jgi:hypothetical protein
VAFLILRACIAGLGLFDGAALQFQRQNQSPNKGAIEVNSLEGSHSSVACEVECGFDIWVELRQRRRKTAAVEVEATNRCVCIQLKDTNVS